MYGFVRLFPSIMISPTTKGVGELLVFADVTKLVDCVESTGEGCAYTIATQHNNFAIIQ
jgi:hypothetical protein